MIGTPRPILFIGDSDAGKTNYIARLWVGIQHRGSRLRLRRMPANAEYLNDAQAKLLAGEFAGHTSTDVVSDPVIPITVEYPTGKVEADLVIPDYPGEQFRQIYEAREWADSWERRVASCPAILVFIRTASEQIVAPLDWVQASRYWGGQTPPANDAQSSPAPTQVVLVDWLQFLQSAFADLFGGTTKLRVGIVLSAWDLVPRDLQADPPQSYLKANFPLLAQFISSNSLSLEARVFGLSIVGGDLKEEPEFRTAFLAGDPALAGYTVSANDAGEMARGDVTAPILWALRLEE